MSSSLLMMNSQKGGQNFPMESRERMTDVSPKLG